jgi:hypothetical protein
MESLREITDSDLTRIRKVDGYVSVFDVIRAGHRAFSWQLVRMTMA